MYVIVKYQVNVKCTFMVFIAVVRTWHQFWARYFDIFIEIVDILIFLDIRYYRLSKNFKIRYYRISNIEEFCKFDIIEYRKSKFFKFDILKYRIS